MSEGGRRLSLLLCEMAVPRRAWAPSTLAQALAAEGAELTTVDDGPAALSGFDAVLLAGNPGWYPRMRGQLRSVQPAARPLVATFHAEPLPPPRASGISRWSSLNKVEVAKIVLRDRRATDIYSNAVMMRRWTREGLLDLVFVTSLEKQDYLAEHGIRSCYVPYGYHPSHGRILDLERTIDVLFLGETRPRRRRRLLRYLRRHGIDVLVRGSWYDPNLWGEGRSRLLNQTKIVVHLQRYPGKLAAMRLVIALANGALVVAEPSYRPDPFVPGRHFVMCPHEEMPETIRHYLAHPEERERLVAAGHKLVTEEHTFARSARLMLDAIAERGADV